MKLKEITQVINEMIVDLKLKIAEYRGQYEFHNASLKAGLTDDSQVMTMYMNKTIELEKLKILLGEIDLTQRTISELVAIEEYSVKLNKVDCFNESEIREFLDFYRKKF